MDTVEKTIKDAGFLMRKHVKGIIDMFRNTLMEGEELLGAECRRMPESIFL